MEDETINIKEENEMNVSDDGDDEKPSMSVEDIVAPAEEYEPVMIDLKNKMAITYNVLKACIKEKRHNVYYCLDSIVDRLAFLTNLQTHVLLKIVKKAKQPTKTDVLNNNVLETPLIDFLIRHILIKHYVKCNEIPKAESLAHLVNDYCNNNHLNQQLRRSGYIWRRLPKTKKAIIVEHPKQVVQRQNYLLKMIDYRRTENRRIVYIETKVLTKADEDFRHLQKSIPESVNFVVVFIAVDNNKGFLNGHVFVNSSIFVCQKQIEEHIIKNVLPSTTEPSVIILEQKPYYRKSLPVPTIESKKSEMVKWLEINGLPHDENLHRCELFDLIQRCKTKCDLHKFDAVLHSYGHEILYRPARTDYLNYFKPMWKNILITEEIIISISEKSPQFWKFLEVSLIQLEKSVLYEDSQMENITDRILTMANNIDVSEWADAECDEEQDSLVQEKFVIQTENSFSTEELQKREQEILLEIKKNQRY